MERSPSLATPPDRGIRLPLQKGNRCLETNSCVEFAIGVVIQHQFAIGRVAAAVIETKRELTSWRILEAAPPALPTKLWVMLLLIVSVALPDTPVV
jgi:hypothetical protein